MKRVVVPAVSLALFVILTMIPAPVMADSLAAGGSVIPTAVPGSFTSSLTLLASVTAPFTISFGALSTSGDGDSWVYRTAGGTLDFLFQVTTNPGSNDQAETLSMALFGSFTTDVDYLTGTSVVPASSSRSSDGNIVNFGFVPGFDGGQSTAVLVIETNATSFTKGLLSIQDTGNDSVSSFEPTGVPIVATPEPSGLVMLGYGLLGLAGLRRRTLTA